jgi:hypothetical protein
VNTSRRSQFHPRYLAAPLLFAAALASCGGGGGGGGGIPAAVSETEANDTIATANLVPVGTPVVGDVTTAADIDYFKINLATGRIVEIELFATRGDQETWDAADNVPRLTLWDTDANANAKLLEHDYGGFTSDGWSWGKHDLDMPMFKVPATGAYFVSVTQDDTTLAGGSYALRVHYITVSNLQEETEPTATDGVNDTPATAQVITPGTIHGFHVSGGLDYYTFTVAANTTVRFEMTAYRNGPNRGDANYYDPYIYLYDIDGTTELASDDDSYFYDSSIQYNFDLAGTYFVSIDEFAGANSEYFLSYSTSSSAAVAESEPNDDTTTAGSISYGGRVSGDIDAGEVDFFKFTGTKGDMVRLQRFDANNLQGADDTVIVTMLATDGTTALSTGGDFDFQTQTTILQETGTFYIKVEPNTTLTDYALELTRFKSATYETEANDTIATADSLSTRVAGVIDPVGDADVYSFSTSTNHLVEIVCYASISLDPNGDGDLEYSGHGSACSPLLEVLDGTGAVVATFTSAPATVYAESVTDPLPTCQVVGVPDPGGIYYVRVTDALGGGGPGFYYVLEKR